MEIKDIYTISEFAELLGVTVQTLRNWDKSGKLVPDSRTQGGNRLYNYKQLLEFKRKTSGDKEELAVLYIIAKDKKEETTEKMRKYVRFKNIKHHEYVDDKALGPQFKEIIQKVGLGTYTEFVINESNSGLTIGELNVIQAVLSALHVNLVLI